MPFSDDERKKLIEAFGTKRTKKECPTCGHTQWILAEQYTPLALQEMNAGVVIGGPSIPTVALVCKNCGFVSLHSSKVLAGLPEEGKTNG